MNCDRQQSKLCVDQEFYVKSLLEKFKVTSGNSMKTPLSSAFNPIVASKNEIEEAKHLKSLKNAASHGQTHCADILAR